MKAEQSRIWFNQAQAEAERGVLQCRMCKRYGPLDEALTVWRNGLLVFAVCDPCSTRHEVVFKPTQAGVEIRARATAPLIITG